MKIRQERLKKKAIALSTSSRVDIRVVKSTDSTNRLARKMRSGAVFALQQTKGRGRGGKSFESPEGGIYFSLCRPCAETPTFYTAAAAVAVKRALRRIRGGFFGIKWVNDVYNEDGKKVCGILCEYVAPTKGVPFVVIGVGVNYASTLSPELKDTAASLYKNSAGINAAAAIILDELIHALERLEQNRMSIVDEYAKSSILIGKKITIADKSGIFTAIGINPDCTLRVKDAEGAEFDLAAGQVRLVE